jgi:site-specific recombinase XerD
MNTEFTTEFLTNLKYSFSDKEIQIIANELNRTLSNYNVTKIESFNLTTIEDYNDNLLKRYIIKKDISGISKSSIEQYVRETKKFLFTINKKACDVTTQDAENYLVTYKYQYGVSNTTLNNMRIFINNFFIFLFNEEVISRNPFDKVTSIKNDTIRDKAISKSEEEKLYAACNNFRDRAILETLFATGCRVSELVNIKINDIDFINKTIDVIGKGNKPRTVCISEKALFHIQRYLNNRQINSEYLFVNNHKPFKKLSISGVQSILKSLELKTGLTNIHPHRFRSTFATRLIDSGMSIQQVSKLLGHSSVDTTMIYYRGNYNLSNDYNKITNV